MFARGLTCLSLLLSAVAACAMARAAWRECQDHGGSLALELAPLFPPVVMAAAALACRRRLWPALALCGTTALMSAVAVYCWEVACPAGPDAYETLHILRGLAVAVMLGILAAGGAVAAAVSSIPVVPVADAEPGATADPAS